MLTFLTNLFSSEDSDWEAVGGKQEKTVQSVDAADGKTYRKVQQAEKEVNFETGAIRLTPVKGSTPRIVVE